MIILTQVQQALEQSADRPTLIAALRALLHSYAPQQDQPVDHVQWVPLDQVSPNDYNPNHVAKIEMGLLYTSILHDGYTQPIVTVRDDVQQQWVIVDGFHRYYTMKLYPDIAERTQNHLPIVVLNKSINDRMASTVRHNRARGKHTVQGMSSMIFAMLEHGWSDTEICAELGMNAEELTRLKHITGFSKLFQNVQYQQAWVNRSQLRVAREYQRASEEAATPSDTSSV